jgi:hypothetical protein
MAPALDMLKRLCRRRTEVEGELGYFGLGPWWSAAFTRTERDHIEASFQPPNLPRGARPLTTGQKQLTFQSAAGLLTAVAASLRGNRQDRPLAMQILAKAEERARAEDSVLGLHFVYQETIRLHNKWRDYFPDALDLTFGACHKQVAMARIVAQALRDVRPKEPLPVHLGFQQLAFLLEKEGSYTKAIEICKEARDQGWNGNWTWRIGCLAKKRDEQDRGVRSISPSGLGPV